MKRVVQYLATLVLALGLGMAQDARQTTLIYGGD